MSCVGSSSRAPSDAGGRDHFFPARSFFTLFACFASAVRVTHPLGRRLRTRYDSMMRRDARPSRSARSPARVIALVAVVSLFLLAGLTGLGGCSLVSGWSDLQTATKDAARPGTTDSGNGTSDGDSGDGTSGGDGDSGTSGTSGTSGDSGNTTPPVVCGAGVCPAGEGCCVSFTGTKTCGPPTACDVNMGDMFFACTSSASCDSRAPICCYDFSAESAACAGACGQGNTIVCDSPPNACPQGKACTGHSAGVPSVRTCQ